MVDVSGYWRYRETFDFGGKAGEARLFQNGELLSGSLFFKETSEGADDFFVRVILTGVVRNDEIILHDQYWTVVSGGADDDYLPEERTGILNQQGQIVGSVMDVDSVGGVFIMDRLV
jgi:hypothetical protein